MGIDDFPEILLARKIVEKYKISIPFDLDKIVEQYATLIYRPIPISGVDGVSLNLKTPGKKPTVIVNSKLPKTRQRFTLAHELGHLIIPWHLGTIVDDIYNDAYKNFLYSQLEQEANRFAAEILLPEKWIIKKISDNTLELAQLHKQIARESGVSDHATAIRLIKYLPKNIIYIAEEFGIVEHTAKTERTIASLQKKNSEFDKDFYIHIKAHSKFASSTTYYHWYELNTEIELSCSDERSWREILNKITRDIHPKEGDEKFKKSINGIISFAHGIAKRESDYSLGTVISACLNKLKREGLEKFVSHPDFENFILKRAEDFIKK
jgi:Zn-dependent peptidase ImmA (M78 family)